MIASMTIGTFEPLTQEQANQTYDRYAQLLSEQKGFKRVTLIFDPTTHEYGNLAIWESRADAEAGI